MERDLSYGFKVTALSEEDGGGFQATIPEFARGVVGYGETQVEAVKDLYELLPDFLDVLEESGQPIPAPQLARTHQDFSGKFNVRVPRILHANLVEAAEENGVSLNSMITTLLAEGVAKIKVGIPYQVKPELTLATTQPAEKLAEERSDYST